ncbi:C4-dicarboxylate ABC transporter substrate-binding protein [Rhodobacter sphaeroides]|jgi:TRAP-type C4-dicarboxylate transport system substrate-binding protein|uniref:TRAP-T family transporter, periplasmic binding protein n=2 Tax=Cereibacter sphaeroides TaxID=1063 RepID=Q3IWM7_CERS4|nr:TRAP transporter substrate-binding protein [Cereibacter sphaeroides]ABN78198.1 TRAP dicarboxylate transporter- DctP subunit [Cereibacter sphaeroides ATCC 17029]ABA81057.1 TRAP-T family transporter, periplasmic binding protein [Cereibacter sphaeroides 2.4.1]AMJ49372.1 C4-dicarboxylate ABC transporter substrate-binding protein [Cereibacter sphaeroides]ANS36080.1 C4-dicarboxylate ABC transporter substrate-binding protein [Cereibacter sphaeroides]ATN65145.1 C4-dicarboxylate ABC transporter subs
MKQGSIAATAAFAVSVAATSAWAETKWDMSIVWPEGNFHTQNAMAFADAVKEATDGEVVITVHSGGALGIKGPEGMAAVRDGLVPIAEILLNQQVGEAPVLGIETLPFLAPTMADLALLHKFYRPKLDEVAAGMNQKILYMVPWPGQAVFAPNPINTVEDLKGLTIRVVDSNGNDFFGALGATPIQMPWGEVVPSLAAGTIKGVTTSSSSGVDGAFWEFTKYMSTFNWQASSNIMSVNLDAWNELPLETRQKIEETAAGLEGQFWLNSRAEDAKKIATLKENGVEVSAPSPELSAALLEKALPLWDAYKTRVPEAAPIIDAYLTLRN